MAGYSSNPLFKKLGIKEGMHAIVTGAPANYEALLGDAYATLHIKDEKAKEADFIHLFTNDQKMFEKKLASLKSKLKKDGMIWVSWYKKAAKKPTELDENRIRDYALSIGLVDVKVCAIDDDWSGLKLVYRLSDR